MVVEENKTPSFFGRRTVARLMAVQALSQYGLLQTPQEEILKNLPQMQWWGDFKLPNPDYSFLEKLVEGVIENKDNIESLVSTSLPETWTMNRLELVLKAILYTATYELLFMPDLDTAIILNEYLDITHSFYDQKGVGFVNSVLAKLFDKTRSNQHESV